MPSTKKSKIRKKKKQRKNQNIQKKNKNNNLHSEIKHSSQCRTLTQVPLTNGANVQF